MKSDLNDLKKLTMELMQNGASQVQEKNKNLIQKTEIYHCIRSSCDKLGFYAEIEIIFWDRAGFT